MPALFAPAYIGGRTAAEHWDLTEQISKDIVVVTGQAMHLKSEKSFGTKPVWRHHSRVPVSDVHRSIIDMLDDPAIGGIQQVADCLSAYFKGPDRSEGKLIEYADQLGNGAVFKRLGFLADRQDGAAALAEHCRARLTAGNAQLDPALECERLISRWRLLVPHSGPPETLDRQARNSRTGRADVAHAACHRKDYVLGWMLAGIYAHEELVESWIFKGRTCLKKCFF